MISIVIPTLNEQAFIGRMLKSIKKQSFRKYEVLVVDANSKDDTQKIVRTFKFAKLINSSKKNVSYQRNLGALKAKYERLLFMDADGSLDADFLKKALDEIDKKNLKVTGSYIWPDSDKRYFKASYWFFRLWVRFVSLIRPVVNGACLFSTKSIHDKIKGFNEKIPFAEDYDYAQRASKYSNVKLLKSVKLYTSVRRFRKQGRIRQGIKYFFMGIYITLFGPPKAKIFKYEFGNY